jgi:DNA-directed RNA polymerase specialized sigma24 family protein
LALVRDDNVAHIAAMECRDFPITRVSVIEALSSDDSERRRTAADLLARAYWMPIVVTLSTRWHLDRPDAEDLTQEFLAEALRKEWLVRYDPAKARFRTFLRICLDRFAANAQQARRRLKRGGGAEMLSIDDDLLSVTTDDDADDQFRQEWVRSVFTLALEALRHEAAAVGKNVNVAIFVAYDVDDTRDGRPSYRALGERFSLPETTITNHLAWARRSFRRHVLEVLRSLAGSEAEYRRDARELLGVRLP